MLACFDGLLDKNILFQKPDFPCAFQLEIAYESPQVDGSGVRSSQHISEEMKRIISFSVFAELVLERVHFDN